MRTEIMNWEGHSSIFIHAHRINTYRLTRRNIGIAESHEMDNLRRLKHIKCQQINTGRCRALQANFSVMRLPSELRQVMAVRNHLSRVELFKEHSIGIGECLPVPVRIVVDQVFKEVEADAIRGGGGQVDAAILGLATR